MRLRNSYRLFLYAICPFVCSSLSLSEYECVRVDDLGIAFEQIFSLLTLHPHVVHMYID